jgi:hypothetical protein
VRRWHRSPHTTFRSTATSTAPQVPQQVMAPSWSCQASGCGHRRRRDRERSHRLCAARRIPAATCRILCQVLNGIAGTETHARTTSGAIMTSCCTSLTQMLFLTSSLQRGLRQALLLKLSGPYWCQMALPKPVPRACRCNRRKRNNRLRAVCLFTAAAALRFSLPGTRQHIAGTGTPARAAS